MGLLAMDRPRTQEKNKGRYYNFIGEFHDNCVTTLLLAALLSFTNGQSSNQGIESKYPPKWHRSGETFHDTGAVAYLSNKYDAHLALVKLGKPHRRFVFNHLGVGSPSE